MRIPLPLRLASLPALAAVMVLLLGMFTLLDLSRSVLEERRAPGRPGAGPLEPDPAPAAAGKPRPLAPQARALMEEEAWELLEDAPDNAALETLWRNPRNRERLLRVLASADSPPEVRLRLLGLFAGTAQARHAARSLLGEGSCGELLRLGCLRVLAESGNEEDLGAFDEHPGESFEARTLREKYRARLKAHLGNPENPLRR